MAFMEDLPPKAVKAQLVRLDDNLKQLERAQFAGIQRAPGSLPVLEAFQLFLEQERKTARRRILAVAGLSLFLILSSLTGAGFYIHYALRQTGYQTEALAGRTTELAQSIEAIHTQQRNVDNILSRTELALAAQQLHLEAQERELKEAQELVHTDLQASRVDIIALREQLESLLADQTTLRQNQEATRFPQHADVLVQAMPDVGPPTIGPARRRIELPPVAAPQAVPFTIVTISPEGRPDGIRWILPTGPMPE